MQIKDIMTKEVNYINSTNTLKEAANIMRDKDVGALPVGENDRLIGIITDRDIAIRATANGADPKTTTVKQAMTPKCLYCFEDDPVEGTAKNMAQNQVRRLPVMNQDKRLVGIVTLSDLCLKGTKQAAEIALEGVSHQTKH